jgi:dTDP-4-amino-4,6-dideoxygalactose transaminase
MYKNKIKNFLNKKTEFKFVLFSGRTNTQIWKLGNFIKKKYKNPIILLPASMCVSPAIIFTFLKIKIRYVDVNPKTGLIEEHLLRKQIKKEKINVVFFVNLFGNIANKTFYQNMKKDNIFIIQDLAQTFISYDKKINQEELFGDVILLSFGYSKIFDLGKGSIMLTNKTDINNFFENNDIKFNILNKKQKNLYYTKYLYWYNSVFSKSKKISKSDIESFTEKLYLKNIPNSLYKKIYDKIINLYSEEKRRNKILDFYKLIFNSHKIKILHSTKTLLPWRFSFRVKENRQKILEKLRNNNFDASSYYLSLSDKKLKNSIEIEKEVINLWLTNKISRATVKNQYRIIKNIL